MDTLIVKLPPPLQEFVESVVVKTSCNDPADFVRHLLEEAQNRWIGAIEKMVDEAIASGPTIEWTSAEGEEIRRMLCEKYGGRTAGSGEPDVEKQTGGCFG